MGDGSSLKRKQYLVWCLWLCPERGAAPRSSCVKKIHSSSACPLGIPCGFSGGLSFCLFLILFSVHDLNGSLHPMQFQKTLALAIFVHQKGTEAKRADSPIARGHDRSCTRISISCRRPGRRSTCHQVLTAHHQCQIQRQCRSSMHLERTAFCEHL